MHSRGFTLVELILVIVVIGILAAVVGPRFFDRQVFDDRMAYEEGLSAVRYAQKLAVASGCPVRAQVNADGYALRYGAACGGLTVPDPSGGSFEHEWSAPVTVQPLLVEIAFNTLGCVSETNICPTDGAVIQATIGGFVFRVHAATGFVETTP